MAAPSMDRPSHGIMFQNSVYAGMYIENVLYGVELLLFFKTMRALLTHGGASKKSNIFYALFSTIMVFFATVWIATQAFFCEEMWILNADFPGGANAYWDANVSVWYMDLATTAIIILQLMTDALMIYRCHVIWSHHWIIILPAVLWLATLALGIIVDWSSSLPGGDFFTGPSTQITLAYYAVSVALHAVLTCMICYRLLKHGRAVRAYLGREHATMYFSAASIMVESVLPYTVCGITYLASTGMKSQTSVAFVCVYFMIMCISPQMLILRVITGSACGQDTFKTPPSTVRFDVGDSHGLDLYSDEASAVQTPTLSDEYVLGRNVKVWYESA